MHSEKKPTSKINNQKQHFVSPKRAHTLGRSLFHVGLIDLFSKEGYLETGAPTDKNSFAGKNNAGRPTSDFCGYHTNG